MFRYDLLELRQEGQKTKLRLTILIIFGFILSFLIVFLLPFYLSAKDYLSYSEYISRIYGEINTPKTIVLVTLNCVFLVLAIFVMRRIYDTAQYSIRTRIILLIIWFLAIFIWLLVFVLFMPQHVAFDLYSYGDVKPPKEPERYIHFLGLGDIQEFGNGDNRYERSKASVKNVKRVIENFKHPDSLQGLITVGDCTQTGEDGRSFNPNYLADYESRFGLGTYNSIPIQVYECTGNHDWDCTEEIYPRMKVNYANFENPTVKMIKRRNKHRYGITASDDFGNYEWQWKTKNGQYNFIGIALNIGVTNEKLLSGQPKNSINFLKQRVQVHNSPNDRFFILTHYYNDSDEKNIQDCFGNKINQLKAIFIGHMHLGFLGRLDRSQSQGNNVFILPSPTESNGNVALFSYDTVEDRLFTFDITSSYTNEKIRNLGPRSVSTLQIQQALNNRKFPSQMSQSQMSQSQINQSIPVIDTQNLVQKDGSLYLKK